MHPTADADAPHPSAQQNAPAKRKDHKKTRTGCITCRARRVKCDEARPSCRRCVTSKRVCEGYSTPTIPSSSTPSRLAVGRPPAIAPGPSVSPSALPAWTPAERRAFDFYMACSFPRLFSRSTASFWGRVVPALCHREPAVRHAVFAVGGLHESRFHGRPGTAGHGPDYSFAAAHYGKALSALRLWRPPDHGPLGPSAASVLPLVACSLFVCVEFMLGDRAAAHTHIQQGRRVLARYAVEASRTAPAAELIRREIAPVFIRVTLASFLLGSAPEDIPDVFRSSSSTTGPVVFKSVAEADQAMFDILEDGLRFAKASRVWRHDQERGTGTGTGSDSVVDYEREHRRLLRRLDRWEKADAALLKTSGAQSDNITKAYFHLSRIFIGVALELGDLCYDAYTAHFAALLIHIGRQVDANVAKDTTDPASRCRFSFEMGITPPLFYTVIKCRHPGLRRRAIELLHLRVVDGHQDNLWDSEQVVKAALRMVELEEMRGWTLDAPTKAEVPVIDGDNLHQPASGQVSTDWSPDVLVFGRDGKAMPDKPTYVHGLRPNPQPILPGRPGLKAEHGTRTKHPREFTKLARFFRAPPEEISPDLAEEAWAALIESKSRLDTRGLASAAASAAAWAAECSVPTCLQIPGSARIQNVTISSLSGSGSWVSFHVQPDATVPLVGILKEYI